MAAELRTVTGGASAPSDTERQDDSKSVWRAPIGFTTATATELQPVSRLAATAGDELLAEVVRRVRQVVEVQARNHRWRLALPDGFAEDIACNAAGALVDILEREH